MPRGIKKWSVGEKLLILRVVFRDGGVGRIDREALRTLALKVELPPKSTLYFWKKLFIERGSLDRKTEGTGRPHLLSQAEESVFLGWVVSRGRKKKSVNLKTCRGWLADHFALEASKSWISELLHRGGFASHRTRKETRDTSGPNVLEMVKKIEVVRARIKNVRNALQNLHAMDEVSFWNDSSVDYTFSPVGGGQPGIKTGKRLWKIVAVPCIRADGRRLPLVLCHGFAELKNLKLRGAILVYKKGVAGPGNDTTEKWLDSIHDYFDENDILLLDNVNGHHSRHFTVEADTFGLVREYLTANVGGILDPLDNSFNAAFKKIKKFQRRRFAIASNIAALLHQKPPKKSLKTLFLRDSTQIRAMQKNTRGTTRTTFSGERKNGRRGSTP
eukprot:TRINITY_DN6311_c0_g1_i2.p1 TRINITY_DN6311_c0_g1~~TRINITY_DN6311_c0_g1_i2.p1  ORF type:complete len:387 (-),score=43.31 TRINITY_DN6311_c0_g1_i2:144-1304(-)